MSILVYEILEYKNLSFHIIISLGYCTWPQQSCNLRQVWKVFCNLFTYALFILIIIHEEYGFSSSTMKFYTLPSFSQHDQCEFLTLPSFVQHSQKFLFTIVIQHTWFLHNYMWLFNITLFCPAFPNSFCLFTTTWLKGWKRR